MILAMTFAIASVIQYIPRNMHTVFALLCFVVVIHWLVFPYPSGLLHWHCGNLTIAPVPAKQPWWIWINTSCEFIMNDCVTTTKQSTTKPCAYFLGYTVEGKINDCTRAGDTTLKSQINAPAPSESTMNWQHTTIKEPQQKSVHSFGLYCTRQVIRHLNPRDGKATNLQHDDVIKWKHFPRYWPFVRWIRYLNIYTRPTAQESLLMCVNMRYDNSNSIHHPKIRIVPLRIFIRMHGIMDKHTPVNINSFQEWNIKP